MTPSNQGVVNRIGDNTIEVQDIVQMDNNAAVEVASVENPRPMHTELIPRLIGDLDHSIKSFLARPFKFSSVPILPSHTPNSEVKSFFLYSDLMNLPYYKEKLHGVSGFRATTHFRVQTNANRFQQCRLLITFFPGSVDSSIHATKNASLVARTQLPRVELDVNTTDEATLVVPYVSPYPFYAFGVGDTFMGHIGVSIYSPLLTGSGGENAFDMAVWLHFTDVELFWPSDVQPQSGATGGRYKNKHIEDEIPPKDRPVSSALNAISQASNALSGIPLLSSYVAPISWASGILSKTASSFGLCKPNSNSKDVVVLRQTQGWSNGTGRNLGDNLGLFEDNKVTVLEDIGGTGVDQMSLSYVLRIPTFLRSVSFSTAMATDSLLTSIDLQPSAFFEDVGTGTRAPTPLNYFSRMFGLYRGGITVRIKAVKTEFHTGRLRFVISNTGAPATGDNVNFYISKILDLKEASEWTIDVPYMAPSVYSRCDRPRVFPVAALYIANDLRAPETASSSINLLIEVCGAEDFEFAAPATCVQTHILASPASYTADNRIKTNVRQSGISGTFFSQSGDDQLDENTHTIAGSYPLANVPTFSPSLTPSLLCVGERITSLKQLLTRPTYYLSTNRGSFGLNVDIINANNYVYNSPLSAYYFSSIGSRTFLDMIRMCYAFQRGSVCVRITNTTPALVSMWNCTWQLTPEGSTMPSGINMYSNSFYMTDDTSLSSTAYDQASRTVPAGVHYTYSNQGVADVIVPNYSMNPVRRNCWLQDRRIDDPQTKTIDQEDTRVVHYVSRTSNNLNLEGTSTKDIYLSGGDDYQCGFFIGCPFYRESGEMTVEIPDNNNALHIQSHPQVIL